MGAKRRRQKISGSRTLDNFKREVSDWTVERLIGEGNVVEFFEVGTALCNKAAADIFVSIVHTLEATSARLPSGTQSYVVILVRALEIASCAAFADAEYGKPCGYAEFIQTYKSQSITEEDFNEADKVARHLVTTDYGAFGACFAAKTLANLIVESIGSERISKLDKNVDTSAFLGPYVDGWKQTEQDWTTNTAVCMYRLHVLLKEHFESKERQDAAHGSSLEDARKRTEEHKELVPPERMPNKKKDTPDTRGAKAETTGRSSRFIEMRKGKRGLVTYVKEEKAEEFKAIAAANDLGVDAYLEKLVLKDIETNAHQIEIGREKLKKPRRYRSRAAEALKEENQRLKSLLSHAGLRPK